jgi:hypothetical protein
MTWNEGLAAAKEGKPGIRLSYQPVTDDGGSPLLTWVEKRDGVDTRCEVAPKDWAAYRQEPGSDGMWLHVQNY